MNKKSYNTSIYIIGWYTRRLSILFTYNKVCYKIMGSVQYGNIKTPLLISTDVNFMTNFTGKINYKQDGNTYYLYNDKLTCTVKLGIRDKYCVLTKSENTDMNSSGYWSIMNLIDCMAKQDYTDLFDCRIIDEPANMRKYATYRSVNLVVTTNEGISKEII